MLCLADAATEGKNVITGMLIVGLIFLAVIALGETLALAAPPPRRRPLAPPQTGPVD